MATKNSEEVSLLIDNEVFRVNKEILCEHSDYFRAMFSGNYIEEEKNEITIDVVDANSMKIIIRYMQLGLIDLAEYSLPTIAELAISANFLQITELMIQIEYYLQLHLSPCNWEETVTIAENASYLKLEEHCAAYALFEFKLMKPQYIQLVQRLVWYLSHKYINVESEYQVFRFGVDWIRHKQLGADVLLLILGCLDMSRLTKEDLSEMKILTKDYVNSLAEKLIDCLYKLASDFEISESGIKNNKNTLCEMFTERVYTETLNIVSDSSKRELKLKPCVGLWSKEKSTQETPSPISSSYLYMFNEGQGFTKWLEVTEKDLWGWSVVAWGNTKIVIVCGEHGRGTGFFWKNVKVYDILKKEWTEHLVNLPVRRHGGVGIIGDSLYIIGGVGGYRVLLDTVVVYDLKAQSWRYISKFPEAIQSPAVCIHNGKVYAAGHKTIYQYFEHEDGDRWAKAIETEIRPSFMISYKGFIYCTQNYFTNLYRFKPETDGRLQLYTYFSGCPSTLCHLGDRLLAFTSTNGAQADMVSVEEYKDDGHDDRPIVLWSRQNCIYTINDVAGNCAIADMMPPIQNKLSSYLKRCLAHYDACHSN